MKKIKTKLLSGVLALGLMLMLTPFTALAEGNCVEYLGSNVERQNYVYNRWAVPINSYLATTSDGGLMVVQADDSYLEGIAAVYYDRNYQFKKKVMIPQELPMFGAFYETEDNYYLLTGQTNAEERADVEAYRITKYDKSWKRLGSVGLYDCNTVTPFEAGSARMAHQGKYLLIRTCHLMYKSSDGRNHQANVTIQVDTDQMKITDSYTKIMNVNYGYVSHSFNQFILLEDGKIVSLDHGDANPRSAVLLKYTTDVSSGRFSPSGWGGYIEKKVDVLTFPGQKGLNDTGAAFGGFEASKGYYLVAGSSVVQDERNLERTTRNVFVAAVDKSTDAVNMHWLTNYAEGEETASVPQMVKVADEKYMVLWSRNGKVNYTLVDGTGNKTGETYQTEGSLSDCVPLVVDGKAVWYTWNSEGLTFYEINLNDLKSASKWEVKGGHDYEYKGTDGGYANLSCKVCGASDRVKVITKLTVFFGGSEYGGYSSGYNAACKAGDRVFFMCSTEPYDAEDVIQISTDNTDVLEVVSGVDAKDSVRIKQAGTAGVVFTSKYNPELSLAYTFTITGDESGNPSMVSVSRRADNVAVDSIALDRTDAALEQGQSIKLTATTKPENATNRIVKWSSSNSAVARVSDDGTVTAISAGSATVTATAADGSGKSASCTVKVNGGNGTGGNGAGGNGTGGNGAGGNGAGGNGGQGSEGQTGSNDFEDIIPAGGFGWSTIDGKSYWYEEGVRQGTALDSKGVIGDGTVRGREIADPGTPDEKGNASWFWLDAVYNGAKAVSKEVWMPYIYQDEKDWDDEKISSVSKESGDMAAQVEKAIRAAKDGVTDSSVIGKWVRYDSQGRMIKGWYTVQGDDANLYPSQAGNTYYYDYQTGLMAKGTVTIAGRTYQFDEVTGALIK